MNYGRCAAVVLAALCCAAGPLVAASPDPTAEEQRQEGFLVKNAEVTNQECGTQIPVTFDWKNVPPDSFGKYSASSYCDNMLAGLRHTCSDAAGKKAVKRKIKTISCGFGAKRTMSLKNGVLDYKINFDSSNDDDFSYEYLQNHL